MCELCEHESAALQAARRILNAPGYSDGEALLAVPAWVLAELIEAAENA